MVGKLDANPLDSDTPCVIVTILSETRLKRLNDKRTFVYPCVLRSFVAADGSERLIPWFQYLFSAVSVGMFLASLLRCAWNPWLALAAASPILTSPMVLEYSGVLTPDLWHRLCGRYNFAVVDRRAQGNKPLGVGGVTIFLFLAYQTKPFLSLFCLRSSQSVAGLLVGGCSGKQGRLDSCIRFCLASLLPFLAWSALRWFVVGHFGLVSFGGYNIIGIAGQFLQKDSTTQLSTDIRPLAVES